MAKKFGGILDYNNNDCSIWHGYPGGIHSFGSSSAFRKNMNPVGVDYYTYIFDVQDIVSLHLTGTAGSQTITQDSFIAESWNWYPTHIQGIWNSNGLKVEMKAIFTEDERACVFFNIVNETGSRFIGDAVLYGDQNRSRRCSWEKYILDGKADMGKNSALITKCLKMGVSYDAFPWIMKLSERKLMHWRYYQLFSQIAVFLPEEGWKPGNNVTDKKTVLQRWSFNRELVLEAGASFSFSIQMSFHWHGTTIPTSSHETALLQKAQKGLSGFDDLLGKSRETWEKRMEKIPVPSGMLPEKWTRLYYKAWIGLIQNTIPPLDAGIKNFKNRSVSADKVANSWLMGASWEASLAAYCLGFIDMELAAEVAGSVLEAVEEDGFLPEDMTYSRGTSLPLILPYVAVSLYEKGLDKSYLEEWYPVLKKALRYQYRHPNFKHLGLPIVRNYMYAYYSARYLRVIAGVLSKSEEECYELECLMQDLLNIIQSFWDEKKNFFRAQFDHSRGGPTEGEYVDGTNAECLIGLYGAMTEVQSKILLEWIREDLLSEEGMLANQPKKLKGVDSGLAGELKWADFALKSSNYLFLFNALKLMDADLCETVIDRTLEGISKDGDFHESYTIGGEGRHNGPMGMFGIFAVIHSVLMSSRYGPQK